MAERKPDAPAGFEFVLSRVFDATREQMWKVWTDPKHLMQWWGPKGFTMKAAKVDLRHGGIFHYGMLTPDGKDMWGKFTYREIAPPERLVFVVNFSDENGGITRHPMNPNWPLSILSTITFAEEPGGKTKVTVQWSPLNPTDIESKTFEEGKSSMQQGWGGTMEQLAAYLVKA